MDLVKLYWQIYGLAIIMNNKFMFWLVRSYIAKLKGHLVNWAISATSIAKEKACRLEVKGLKSGLVYLSKLSFKDLGGRFEGEGMCATHTTKA
jgi:hypothetical protein